MTERQNEGAGFDAQDRGALTWRLETLHKRTEEGVRELGAQILDMYHQGAVDTDAVREGAARLDELERSASELEEAMRGETGPRAEPPRQGKREPRQHREVPPEEEKQMPDRREKATRPPAPAGAPAIRPVLGAEEGPATPAASSAG